MYESFYGLSAKPFQLNPDPAFYFDSKQHRKAKAYLDYGLLRNEGFIVITGEIGAGKTTVLRGLLDALDGERVCVAQLVTTQLDAQETLHMIGAAFGVPVTGRSKAELLTTLEAFFIGLATQGKRCLLIVDEAQNLDPRALEELRMLSNYQLGTHSLLQAFLVGQPQFRETLRRPAMEQLRQRIAAACHIGPLDLEDTRLYVEHRLRRAGASDRPSFDDACFEALYRASQGVPRRINMVCDRLLLHGYLAGSHRFAGGDVEEVAQELESETRGVGLTPPRAPMVATASDETPGGIAHWLGEQQQDRLERIEAGLLRLERLALRTLSALQRRTASEPQDRSTANDKS